MSVSNDFLNITSSTLSPAVRTSRPVAPSSLSRTGQVARTPLNERSQNRKPAAPRRWKAKPPQTAQVSSPVASSLIAAPVAQPQPSPVLPITASASAAAPAVWHRADGQTAAQLLTSPLLPSAASSAAMATAAQPTTVSSAALEAAAAVSAAAASDPIDMMTLLAQAPTASERNKEFQKATRQMAQAAVQAVRHNRYGVLNSEQVLDMRYSQNSVSDQVHDGNGGYITIADLKKEIWTNPRWTHHEHPPIDIVKYEDGSLTSIANRRLIACKAIANSKSAKRPELQIPVVIHRAADQAPASLFKAEWDTYQSLRIQDKETHGQIISSLGIEWGSYAHYIYLRAHSCSNIKTRPADNDCVQGFEGEPYIRSNRYNG
jgi:hypothetical protein